MKPKVILFNAVTLDGRLGGFLQDIGQYYTIARQWSEDATIAGCDTLLAHTPEDMPPETMADWAPLAVEPGDTRPVLVVPDSRGRMRYWHYLKQQRYWRDFIALCSQATPPEHLEYLDRLQIKRMTAGADHVDLARALDELNGRFGIQVARVDAGATLTGEMIRLGLADEIHLLVHPRLAGGGGTRSIYQDWGIASPEGGIALRLRGVETRGDGLLLLSYEVAR